MIQNIKKDIFQKEVLDSKETVIIDFNANWCGPCRMLRPILEEVSNENPNIKIVSINVDEEKSLTKEYHVFSIPCLIFVKDGKEMKRHAGLVTKEELENLINE